MHSLTNKIKGRKMAKAKAKPAAKKAAPKKAAAKKAAPKKAAAKKAAPKKAAAKKAAPKKPAAKKAAVKKPAAKKAAPKKAAAKKAAPKKAAKKPAAKKAAKKAAPKKVAKPAAPKKAPKPAAPKGPYTKGDIVNHLAYTLDVTKKTANGMLDELTALIASNAKKTFTLPGVGKFSTGKTKKRNGRNPSTGAAIVIPAKNKVKFKVGKALQDAVFPSK
jgi:nucleoid DNA-binding protein